MWKSLLSQTDFLNGNIQALDEAALAVSSTDPKVHQSHMHGRYLCVPQRGSNESSVDGKDFY